MEPSALTRNLYREDEVIASLRWCALKGGARGKEAIFWAQEALDSGMRLALYESLFWVWALTAATTNPGWLLEFRTLCQKGSAATGDEIQYCVMRLMRGGRDTTALVLLSLGLDPTQSLCDRVGQPKTPAFSAPLTPILETIARAISQGKAPFAWALARPLWTNGNTLWTILAESSKTPDVIRHLEMAHMWLPFDTSDWHWAIRAAAIAIATFGAGFKEDNWVAPTEWVAYKYEWQHLTMLPRRIHLPPQEALYWFTARGSLPINKTTEHDLIGSIEPALRASTFWGPILLTAPIWSDDAREAFYDRYFLNDIPDEWPSAYRLISHGAGVVPAKENPDYSILFETAVSRWFRNLPCSIWLGFDSMLPILRKRIPLDPTTGRPAELVKSLSGAYEAQEFSDPNPEILRPCRRELVAA